MSESKKTVLFETHKKLGAKMVPFGGWMMPVSYEGVLAEHKTVREDVGIFDVSHMGEIRVKGIEAEKFLQFITINDVSKLTDHHGQYTAILNENGGMIDDLIIYRLAANEFFICANASNIEKDFSWIETQSKKFNVVVTNESSSWSQLAVQGPKADLVISPILGDQSGMPYMTIKKIAWQGSEILIARTGYTGEYGFEIYLPNQFAEKLWQAFFDTKAKSNLKPCGLGARDTLRLEACYLLYGNDMDDSVSPLEAGIGWATKINKGDFIGRNVLTQQKEKGVKRQIFAFKMTEDGIPRHGMDIYLEGDVKIGAVTSGSVLPTLGGSGGMMLVEAANVKEGSSVFVDVRGKKKRATVCKRPLYQARTK